MVNLFGCQPPDNGAGLVPSQKDFPAPQIAPVLRRPRFGPRPDSLWLGPGLQSPVWHPCPALARVIHPRRFRFCGWLHFVSSRLTTTFRTNRRTHRRFWRDRILQANGDARRRACQFSDLYRGRRTCFPAWSIFACSIALQSDARLELQTIALSIGDLFALADHGLDLLPVGVLIAQNPAER